MLTFISTEAVTTLAALGEATPLISDPYCFLVSEDFSSS